MQLQQQIPFGNDNKKSKNGRLGTAGRKSA